MEAKGVYTKSPKYKYNKQQTTFLINGVEKFLLSAENTTFKCIRDIKSQRSGVIIQNPNSHQKATTLTETNSQSLTKSYNIERQRKSNSKCVYVTHEGDEEEGGGRFPKEGSNNLNWLLLEWHWLSEWAKQLSNVSLPLMITIKVFSFICNYIPWKSIYCQQTFLGDIRLKIFQAYTFIIILKTSMSPKILKSIIIKGTLYHKSKMKCLEWTIYSSYCTHTKPTGHTSIILSHACFCCATNSLQWVSVFIWVCLPYCRSWLLGSWLMSYLEVAFESHSFSHFRDFQQCLVWVVLVLVCLLHVLTAHIQLCSSNTVRVGWWAILL